MMIMNSDDSDVETEKRFMIRGEESIIKINKSKDWGIECIFNS